MHAPNRLSHIPLLALLLAAAAVGLAGQAGMTDEALGAQGTAPILDAAKGGNGGNGGNGNGGKGNGDKGNGGKGKKPGAGLSLAIQPDTWNINWEHSNGTVSALIRGGDVGKIDLDSIVLVGTDPAAEPLEPTRVQRSGGQVRARFAKDDALATLDTPAPGEVHEVTIEFTLDDGAVDKSLTDKVRIVGPGEDDDDDGDDDGEDDDGEDDDGEDDEELDLDIQPDSWNVNWVRSNGTVSALIRGDGLADVVLGSILLVGTDPDADPLPALRASRQGNHIRAFFAKDDAFKTLDTPKPGEVHEIIIRFTAAGATEELTDRIRVVGPNR